MQSKVIGLDIFEIKTLARVPTKKILRILSQVFRPLFLTTNIPVHAIWIWDI